MGTQNEIELTIMPGAGTENVEVLGVGMEKIFLSGYWAGSGFLKPALALEQALSIRSN